MKVNTGSIPLHIARAYGVAPMRPAQPVARPQQAPSPTDQQTGGAIQRLVAARVPGGIDFSADVPEPSAESLPMYHHPADRNAAATSVHAGAMIDVRG